MAARFPDPVLNNSVLLSADALDEVVDQYPARTGSVWTLDGADAPVAAVTAAGFVHDERTVAMVLELSQWVPSTVPVAVRRAAHVDAVSALNGTSPALLREVPGVRPFLTADGQSGLVTIDVEDDVNVSFVSTAPAARRRGSARAVLSSALADATSRGMRTASLRSTPVAEGLYSSAGFVAVGRWQEWVRARR